jgi:hypothetical protein
MEGAAEENRDEQLVPYTFDAPRFTDLDNDPGNLDST